MESAPLVCIVEDYEPVELAVTKMLRYAHFDVIAAASGPVLDSLLRQGIAPDLFLLDLSLPDESGVSIMRRLRQEPRFAETPIIALTAFSAGRFKREALAMGFDGFIAKPFEMATFTRMIRDFLAARRDPASV